MKLGLHQRRILGLFFTICAGFCALILRLYQIQIIQGHSWADIGDNRRIRKIPLHDRRGTIFTAAGDPLAITIPSFSLAANPSKIKDPERLARLLSPILNIPVDDLIPRLTSRSLPPLLSRESESIDVPGKVTPSAALATSLIPGTLKAPPTGSPKPKSGRRMVEFVWIKRLLEDEQYEAVVELIKADLDEGMHQKLFPRKEYRRIYPQGSMLSQILGFCGIENVGLEGMEYRLNNVLIGTPGEKIIFISPSGKELPRAISRTRPSGYHDVYLTIDRETQHYVEKELDVAFRLYNPKSAFAIAMDPFTGAIQAIANRPTYDPNHYKGSRREMRRNHAITDSFAPGSVFKLITAATALEMGLVTPSTPYNCQGRVVLYDIPIRCMSTHGRLFLENAIEKSCNVGLIETGLKIGKDPFHDYMLKFGFGQKTGIDLPGEEVGLLRPPSQWSGISIAALSIGQEIGVTGIQMTAAIAAIINGGQLITPYIIQKSIDTETGEEVKNDVPRFKHRVISEETATKVRRMMQRVVHSGSGQLAALDDYIVGGKTGTSQILSSKDKTRRYVASFAGFVPMESPRTLIYVVLNEPQAKKVSGGRMAAPVFKEIAKRMMLFKGVQPRPGAGKPVDPAQPPPEVLARDQDSDPVLEMGPEAGREMGNRNLHGDPRVEADRTTGQYGVSEYEANWEGARDQAVGDRVQELIDSYQRDDRPRYGNAPPVNGNGNPGYGGNRSDFPADPRSGPRNQQGYATDPTRYGEPRPGYATGPPAWGPRRTGQDHYPTNVDPRTGGPGNPDTVSRYLDGYMTEDDPRGGNAQRREFDDPDPWNQGPRDDPAPAPGSAPGYYGTNQPFEENPAYVDGVEDPLLYYYEDE